MFQFALKNNFSSVVHLWDEFVFYGQKHILLYETSAKKILNKQFGTVRSFKLWSWRILTFCGFCTFCGLCTFWLFMHFFSRTSRITCCKKFTNKYFNWVVFHDVIYNFYSLKDYSEIKRSKSKLKFLSCQGSEWPHPDGTVYRIVRAGPSRQILRQSETVFRPKICCLSQ